jgi:hypothetical protein
LRHPAAAIVGFGEMDQHLVLGKAQADGRNQVYVQPTNDLTVTLEIESPKELFGV